MTLLKLNRFHWHLTEDQGWRLEIRKYPKLTEIGAWRGDERYGGIYSRADVKEIVEFAAERGIEVVPEIELPGHCVAALASYPELSCTGGPFKVQTEYGIHSDVYCAGNDLVFEFLEGVLGEVVDMFPFGYVHLGADEVPKDRWKACPKCQARIKAEKLKDEHELQSWFVHRVIRFLTGKSRRAICWDEILEGGPPQSVVVQVWRAGANAVSKAAAAGRDIIHSPYSHVYFNEKPTWMDLKHVHSWEPTEEGEHTKLVPATIPDMSRLLGGEACLWTEYCPPERVDAQTYPRLLALAENLWSPREGKDFADFQRRVTEMDDRLERMGISPGPDHLDK
jgi:hexosaminidase